MGRKTAISRLKDKVRKALPKIKTPKLNRSEKIAAVGTAISVATAVYALSKDSNNSGTRSANVTGLDSVSTQALVEAVKNSPELISLLRGFAGANGSNGVNGINAIEFLESQNLVQSQSGKHLFLPSDTVITDLNANGLSEGSAFFITNLSNNNKTVTRIIGQNGFSGQLRAGKTYFFLCSTDTQTGSIATFKEMFDISFLNNVSTDIIPNVDSVSSLGSALKGFLNSFVSNLFVESVIQKSSNSNISFIKSNGSLLMKILSNGNVLLGQNFDSGEKLQVEGTAFFNGRIKIPNNSGIYSFQTGGAEKPLLVPGGDNSTSILDLGGGIVFWNSLFSQRMMTIRPDGRVQINTNNSSSIFNVGGLPTFNDNTSALAGGLTQGAFYRTSTGILMVVF